MRPSTTDKNTPNSAPRENDALSDANIAADDGAKAEKKARAAEKREKRRERRAARISLAGWQVAFALLVAVAALSVIIVGMKSKNSFTTASADDAELDGGILYTEAQFQDAVLLAARDTAQFVVYERDVSVESTLKRTFADWAIFTKTKTMRTYGTGSYAVDLSSLTRESVSADVPNYTVSVKIPRAALYAVTPDYSKTEFQDTERGLLAFGEIKLTAEQENELQRQIVEEMTEALSTDECLKKADAEALERCEKLFAPLVAGVSGDFGVTVVFND